MNELEPAVARPDQPEQEVEVRASNVVLILRTILAQFIMGLAGLLIVITFLALNEIGGEIVSPAALFAVLFFVILLADLGITTLVLLEPLRVNYTIRPGEIVVRHGLAGSHERTYRIDLAETVELEQSLLGRMCDYGNVRIFSKERTGLAELVSLVDLPHPQYYANLIRQQIIQPNEKQEKRAEIMQEEQ